MRTTQSPVMPAMATLRSSLSRLAHDQSGNTMMIVAAATLPLIALIGGSIDMGRSYLTESRLQQACDAGVLAARKKLAANISQDGSVPADVAQSGNRFFNINFRNAVYGTTNRNFVMTLEPDYSISGVARVKVPTTIMKLFGFSDLPITTKCQAKLNFNNTDIMMVLDVTGSMSETNSGDPLNRMDSMKETVRNFHNQVSGSAATTSRIRFGFVPYSTNVNVGGLLGNNWMVQNWKYQSRESIVTGTQSTTATSYTPIVYVSGTKNENFVQSTYPATYHAGTGSGAPGYSYTDANENVIVVAPVPPGQPYYTCDTPAPNGNLTATDDITSTDTAPYAGPPAGTQTTEHHKKVRNGSGYWINMNATTCEVRGSTYNTYTETYDRITVPYEYNTTQWRYKQLPYDVSNRIYESNGCIEERDTYEITDYANIDFNKALDLNIDMVPTADDKTKWRPMYLNLVFARSLKWDNTGTWTQATQTTTDDYINPAWMGLSACPAPAKKLDLMTGAQVDSYLNSLQPGGSTYHDIGMIWGARLLSGTGIFASENQDVPGMPTSRQLIFLTDGETMPLDLSYSSYGLEPLDERRWSKSSALTLTQVVEKRFIAACLEAKKRNITVWLIGFGTTINPAMSQCVDAQHTFNTARADELSAVFSKIASSLGDLRISK